jgi:carbon storage regulator CsrA
LISPEYGEFTMLVLSRKNSEAVVVGGSSGSAPMLKVTVLEIRSGCVRLGFEADATVPVHRLEVWERIRAGQYPDSATESPAAPVA